MHVDSYRIQRPLCHPDYALAIPDAAPGDSFLVPHDDALEQLFLDADNANELHVEAHIEEAPSHDGRAVLVIDRVLGSRVYQ